MFSKWCDFCEREQKCHNENGSLYCIGCKGYLGEAADAVPAQA